MLIAFTGYMGSGKTTAAEILAQHHRFKRHPFAAPLKKMIEQLGVPRDHIYGGRKGEPLSMLGGKSARHAMQTLGTEWGRHMICDDLWIRAWERTLPHGDVVVDDLRFANEAAVVRRLGGLVVRIFRHGDQPRPISDHASERQDFLPDAHLPNNGPIADLQIRLGRLIESFTDHVEAYHAG